MDEQSQPNLTKLEESIIKQYNRLSYGEYTQIYDIEQVQYSTIPNNLPQNVIKNHDQCIILKGCEVFDAITYAVIEYIFSANQQEGRRIINKIRASICDQNFMFGSGYMKGLIIKNIKRVVQNSQNRSKPLANYLNQNDSMTAFTEFWKQVIQEQSQGSIDTFTNEPEPIYFQHISNYLQIGFELCWQSRSTYKIESIFPFTKRYSQQLCSIVINNKHKSSSTQILQEVSFESEQTISYIVLVNQNEQRSTSPFKIDLIDINMQLPEQNGQIKKLKIKAWEVKQQGAQLIEQFKEFIQLIENNE